MKLKKRDTTNNTPKPARDKEIQDKYRTGEYSYFDLALEYGITPQGIAKAIRREKKQKEVTQREIRELDDALSSGIISASEYDNQRKKLFNLEDQ